MKQQPLRVVMSRDASDASHEAMRDVQGVLFREPSVGELLKIYFDDGRYLVTSTVKDVAHAGDDLIVKTVNSTYRLHPDN